MHEEGQFTVGVVIPAYNDEHFLEEAIDSVLGQTYKPTQVVICDDASEDHTPEIIRQYEGRHPEVVEGLYHYRNQGVSANLNSGIERISTDYVSLVAADDYWHEDKLNNEIHCLRCDEHARWAYSLSIRVDEYGRRLRAFQRKFDGAYGWVLYEVLTHRIALRNWTAEMALIHEAGLFDEDLPVYEDWDFKIRLAASAPVIHVSSETVYYRTNPLGLSSSSSPKLLRDTLKAVYNKHDNLIESLDDPKRKHVERLRDGDILRLEIDTALQQGSVKRALAMLIKFILFRVYSLQSWKTFSKLLLKKFTPFQ